VNCPYPNGVAGVDVGDLVAGNLSWQGYAPFASQASTISIQDYYDCDGSKGINALLIINSATWCGACQNEATDLPKHTSSFQQKGIRVLTLMVENQSGAPATLSTAKTWRDYFGLGAFATAADPNFTFAGFGSVGLPLQVIVDPRTMKIVDRIEGYAGYDAVIQLANENAN
jgi:peroxiredoxin